MDIKIQKEEATAVAILSGKLDSMSVPDVEEGLLDIASFSIALILSILHPAVCDCFLPLQRMPGLEKHAW